MEIRGVEMQRAVGQAIGSVALAGVCLVLGCDRRQQIAYRELLDPDPQIRADSAVRLGQARAKDAVESLVELLRDPSDHVRAAAVWALGEIGDPRAVKPLMDSCADSNVQVRLAACRSLGQLGDARAISVLIGLLREMDDRIRLAAARALADIPGRESTEALVMALLEDESDVIRQQSRRLLRRNDAAYARERVAAVLRSGSDPSARTHAAQVLGEMGDLSSLAALEAALDDTVAAVRSRSAHALVALSPEEPSVREALRDRLAVESESLTTVDLAWCLARIGDRSSIDKIRGLLAGSGSDRVRAQAAMALGEVGEPADVPLLEKALEREESSVVRREASVAIHKLKRG